MQFTALEEDEGKRIDAYLHDHLPKFSRSRLQTWIKENRAIVAGKVAKSSHVLRPGDVIEFEVGEMPASTAVPEDIPLDVLYEDAAVVVINKPAGMVVHIGAGIHTGTVVNALLHRFAHLSVVGGDLRPGIVHRLDRFTTGALLVARNDEAHRDVALQFSSREVEKIYLALVEGELYGSGSIMRPISRDPGNRARMTARLETGRSALTSWEAIEHFEGFTLLRVLLGTGRTHQIRAHMAAINHPVAGDFLYGAARSKWERYFLHAHRLTFRSPATGEPVTVDAPLSPDLIEWKESLTIAPTEKGRMNHI
ncbi:MAG TPA: RluA family pseudouridine synthase [Bryobacteraceae bacterium]|nr:RluA family pseudouridine synthase [Bryobacteraceae bacterium]